MAFLVFFYVSPTPASLSYEYLKHPMYTMTCLLTHCCTLRHNTDIADRLTKMQIRHTYMYTCEIVSGAYISTAKQLCSAYTVMLWIVYTHIRTHTHTHTHTHVHTLCMHSAHTYTNESHKLTLIHTCNICNTWLSSLTDM